MKDSQLDLAVDFAVSKYIKANNERFSTERIAQMVRA